MPGAGGSSKERRARRWRRRLIALALGYLVVELAAMPILAAVAPLRVRAWLPAPMYVLGEPSKAHFVPKDYVLVLGDSYAEGQGDWLTEALKLGGNPPFQATDILHARTGRDVITFGSGGADTISSIVYLTQKRFAALSRFWIDDPDEILVYFYEGNDMTDNLDRARRRMGLSERTVESYSDEEIEEHVALRARTGLLHGVGGMFFLPYTLGNAVTGGSSGGKHNKGDHRIEPAPEGADSGGLNNVFRAGGDLFRFSGPAQGPVPQLTEAEVTFSLRLLESSLSWLGRRFDGAAITVVYCPSPLSCYEIVSPRIEVFPWDERPSVFSAEEARARSLDLRRRVGELAAQLDLSYVDATPALEARALREPIHGPDDGKHLNCAGYEALAEALLEVVGG